MAASTFFGSSGRRPGRFPFARAAATGRLIPISPPTAYSVVAPLLGWQIRSDVIREHWGNVIRLVTSLKTGRVAPSVIVPNPLAPGAPFVQHKGRYVALSDREGGEGKVERLEDLGGRLVALRDRLRPGRYDGHHDAVQALIADCRTALVEVHGRLGPWEAAELDDAEAAVGCNFLNLALVLTDKALQVSLLPRDEYELGLDDAKRPAAGRAAAT